MSLTHSGGNEIESRSLGHALQGTLAAMNFPR